YLNDIGDWGAGATPNRTNSGYYGGNIPWFKSGELSEDYITDSEEHITALALKECSLRDNQPGDVLIAMYGATIGKTSILNTRSTSNQAVCACTPFDGLSNQYLLTFLKASKRVFTSMGAGGAQPNISKEKIVATQFALPPLKEQLRIVEKVEQLMSLCDQLEQHSLTSLDAHQQLVDTLLTTLTESQNADELAGNWARISEHFDTLFTTEASIDALKKTILQLAVMGKLVPQDPNDEPASELLKRIAQEKAQLMKDGKIKKQKQLPPIGDEEKPFELPDGWEWCRIGNLVNIRPELVAPDEYQSLPQIAPDIIEKGTGKVTAKRTVKESGVKGPNSRFYKGQIVYSKIRPSLSKAFLAEYDGLCSADMYPLDCFIDRSYLLKSILSEFFLIQVRQAENRIKMPKLNVESFSNILVTVPPSNEQQKIIMKLAAIDAFCDKAKSLIQSAQQTQLHLADALTDAAIN
ncbi:restriction endonuclease subunit S, partial [Salmonella enterica]|nr:restriction endonuclease subunit S [Salmonella enterica]EDE9469789.1 restriction endonuclease subunit S [Salmonella enterica]EIJ8314841.1 restriction endonuclease subunit S [Salmonella enterica]